MELLIGLGRAYCFTFVLYKMWVLSVGALEEREERAAPCVDRLIRTCIFWLCGEGDLTQGPSPTTRCIGMEWGVDADANWQGI